MRQSVKKKERYADAQHCRVTIELAFDLSISQSLIVLPSFPPPPSETLTTSTRSKSSILGDIKKPIPKEPLKTPP
jgi:hypothetical protein